MSGVKAPARKGVWISTTWGLLALDVTLAAFVGGLAGISESSTRTGLLTFAEFALAGPAVFGIAFVAFVVAFGFPILLHELGHAIAGRRVGFTFQSIRVLNLVLANKDGKLKCSLKQGLPFGSGVTRMLASGENQAARWRVYLLGGSAISFLYATLWVLIDIRYLGPVAQALDGSGVKPFLNLGLILFTLPAATCFLSPLIPRKTATGASDMARFLQTFSDPNFFEVDRALGQVIAQWTDGIRAQNWNPADIELLASLEATDTKQQRLRAIILFYNFLDRCLPTQAAAYLAPYIAEDGPEPQGHVHAPFCFEYAFVLALLRRRQDAESAYELGLSGAATGLTGRLRAELALAALRGDGTEAEAKFEEVRKKLAEQSKGNPDTHLAEFDWCERAMALLAAPELESPPEPA